jgi:hypothetical protein
MTWLTLIARDPDCLNDFFHVSRDEPLRSKRTFLSERYGDGFSGLVPTTGKLIYRKVTGRKALS